MVTWALHIYRLVGSIWADCIHIFKDQRISAIIGLVVFSHWVLDFIVHLPDLPLLFDGLPVVGLGLWGSGPGLILSAILEFGLLTGGIAVYWVTRGRAAATGTGVAR